VRRMEAHAVRAADLVLAVSEADRVALIEQYSPDPRQIVVIPNGADHEGYAPVSEAERRTAKRALGLPDKPTVLFAASNVPPNWAGLDWVRKLASHSPQF